MMNTRYNHRMGDFRIREIPEDVHRKLKAFAALAGVSVNEYILRVLKGHVENFDFRKIKIGRSGITQSGSENPFHTSEEHNA